MRKRILASLLTLVMILSLTPMTALAVEPCTETEGCTLEAGHDGDCVTTPDEPEPPADGDENDYYETDDVTDPADLSVEEQLAALVAALPNPADISPTGGAQVEAVYNQISAIYAFAEENGLGDRENGLNDAALNAAVNAVIAALNPVEMLASGQIISTNTTWNTATTLTEDLTVNSGVTLTIGAQVTISGNVTISGGGTIKRGDSYTSALISVPENTSLTLQNITIDGGANWSGNDDETLGRGTTNNGVKAQDAAVRVDGGTLLLNSDAVIQNNDNTNLRDNHYYHSNGWRYYSCGGGVAIYHGGTVTMKPGAEIKNNSITNSGYTKATSGVSISEDSGLTKEGNSHSFGGGIGIYESGTFTMDGGTISGNSAYKPDGDGAAYGGGVGLLSRGVDNDHDSCNKEENLLASFVMNGGQLINNYATSGGGGVRAADDQGDNKIDRKNHSTIAVNGGEISGNSTDGAGGGILISSATLNVGGTAAISNNKANSYGGGIEVSSHSKLTMTGGDVSENVSNSLGGAIHDSGADATYGDSTENTYISISGVIFGGNQATNGGALYCDKSVVSITDCAFSKNKATAESGGGGAIYNKGKGLTINNCTISENSASGKGGGIYASESFSLQNTSVTDNSAESDGGGIYIDKKEIAISGKVIVKGNKANSSTYSSDDVFLDHVMDGAVMKKCGDLTDSEIYFGLSSYYYDDDEQNHVDVTVLSGSDNNTVSSNDVTYMYCDAESFAPYFDSTDSAIKVSSAVTITFNANYGAAAATSIQKVASGKETALERNTFTRTGYTFQKWSTQQSGGDNTYDDKANITTSDDVTLYAQWTKVNSISITVDSSPVTYGTPITLTANPAIDGWTYHWFKVDGENETELENETGKTLTLKNVSDSGSYKVKLTPDGDGDAISSDAVHVTISKATPTISISADKTSPISGATIVTLTVSGAPTTEGTVNVTCDVTGVTVNPNTDGTFSVTLPNETKDYNFTASYMAAENGNYNNAASAACKVSVTRYTSGGGGGGSSSSGYAVSVDSTRNGTVTVSPRNASKGTTVTITVKPNSGYELDDLTVTDKNGDTVKLTRKSDTQYTFTMPASKVTVEATFAKIEEQPDVDFIDVPASAYYYDAVAWAVENGITNGTSATTFSPEATCTRAQTVTFLWRAAGSPAPKSSVNPFTDVQPGAYYYEAVLWAVENGVTNGTSDTTFSPDDTVTRGQTVTFQHRAAGSPAASGGTFADVAADAYYAPAVQWAVANGITNGTSNTTFSPDDPCTRGQIVTFLYRDMAE